jgi:hypothetical protein
MSISDDTVKRITQEELDRAVAASADGVVSLGDVEKAVTARLGAMASAQIAAGEESYGDMCAWATGAIARTDPRGSGAT